MLLRSLLLSSCLMSVTVGHGDIIEVHGSGTTNPSKCYWHIMDSIMDRVKLPTRMTYRAVGSSTGIKEFMGKQEDGYKQLNHFGSGDIPLDAEEYAAISAIDSGMLHLPVVLGAISLFHSIPNVPSGSAGLNMTSCTLARIFKRDITDWLHPDIKAQNPQLEALIGEDSYPIKVARRVLGSSSTSSVTKYLNTGCPEHWPADMVSKELGDKWHPDTLPCEGSGGMTDCIRQTPGTIGYIDAGHGHSQNLVEIELKNKDGNFISSLQSDDRGGIGYAAEASDFLPADAYRDFSKVELLNQAGANTWPIVAMSYIYVRKDWTKYGDEFGPDEQALLMGFLEALYEPTYIDECKELFGFTPAYTNEKLKTLAKNGLQQIIMNETATKYVFESKTMAYQGQEENIISVKRRSNAEYERSQLTKQVKDLKDQLKALQLSQEANLMAATKTESETKMYTDGEAQKVTISLIASIVAIILSALAIMSMCSRSGNTAATTASYSGGEANTRTAVPPTKREQADNFNV